MATFWQHAAMVVSACQTAVLPSLQAHLNSAKQAVRKVSHDSPSQQLVWHRPGALAMMLKQPFGSG